MDVYRRYFRVTEGPLIDAMKDAIEINNRAKREYVNILHKIGAERQYYHIDNRLVAVQFKDEPDRYLYKKCKHGGWYPKRNTKEGKTLHERFKSVKTEADSECLKLVNLSSSPTLAGAGRCYFPTITVLPSEDMVIFISVPWYDEDPDVLAEYVKDKNHMDRNYDAILWKPSEEMVEIKRWEVEKEIDQWNESIKTEETNR